MDQLELEKPSRSKPLAGFLVDRFSCSTAMRYGKYKT